MAKLRNFRGRVGVPFTSDVILRVRPTDYAVTLGDGAKDTLVRGVWVKNRGLFTLGSPL